MQHGSAMSPAEAAKLEEWCSRGCPAGASAERAAARRLSKWQSARLLSSLLLACLLLRAARATGSGPLLSRARGFYKSSVDDSIDTGLRLAQASSDLDCALYREAATLWSGARLCALASGLGSDHPQALGIEAAVRSLLGARSADGFFAGAARK